jgi:PAS domain S-box-containing protein
VVIDAIRTPDGRLVGFAKITRDLTERRAAEEELRRSEERFRLLIQSVSDYAIYMLDPSGIVSSWNPGAERFKGYTSEEIIGEHFSRFYTEEDRAAGVPARALRTAEQEGKFEAEGWRQRKDGSRFWASVVIDPIRASDGTLIGFAKITRDLTERRRSQEELEETRERFFQSQKLEAVGKLTGGVAHDFNNLLSVILGSLHLAQRRLAEGGDVTRLIENSLKAAERGASLTQRMLAFARKQELQQENVDLPGLVRGMADMLQRTIGPRIEIDTHFPRTLSAVHADPRQLELVLMNLVVNARDAMPDGGTITIDARGEEISNLAAGLRPGDYVCLAVQDEGTGMDAQTLSRAVEPFFTTKGVGKGTGLGLPMAFGFAEQSGGKLAIDSKLGKGTRVELWLPVASAQSPGVRTPEAAAPARASESRSILVVDDDPLVLANTVAMLEELGHGVTEASSGKEALRLLREGDADLLVTDYAMPGMTGDELALEAMAIRPEIQVLLVSGYAELPEDAGKGLERLAKPFTEDQLAAAVETVLNRSSKAAA